VAANSIGVRFDRVVTLPSATNHANYVVNGGTVNLADVQLRPGCRSVEVTPADPSGSLFSVCATNVQNVGGNSALTISRWIRQRIYRGTLGTPGDPVCGREGLYLILGYLRRDCRGSAMGDIGGLDDHGHFISN